jgi:hypothetical protein
MLILALLGCFVLLALAVPDAVAQKKKVEVTKKWSGSVDNDKASKPECITNAKILDAVWKEWKAAGELPRVDFTKEIVVAVYSSGSNLNLAGANLDANGNLEVLGLGTLDFGPGFRYVLGVVSKDGVKTVNGKAFPKD